MPLFTEFGYSPALIVFINHRVWGSLVLDKPMHRTLRKEEVIPQGKLQMYEHQSLREDRLLEIQLVSTGGASKNILTFTTDNLPNPLSSASLMAETTVYDSLVLYYKLQSFNAPKTTFADKGMEKAFKFLGNLDLYHVEIQGMFMSRCYKFYFKGPVSGEVLPGLNQRFFNLGAIHLVVEASTFDTETQFYTERATGPSGSDKKNIFYINRYALTDEELMAGINACANISANPKSICRQIINQIRF